MDFVSLISNTGIQFCNFKIKLNENKFRELRFNYYEGIDSKTFTWWFEELIEIREIGKYIRKSELNGLNIPKEKINDFEQVSKIINSNVKLYFEEDERTFVIRNVERTLKKFEKTWLPVPYFKSNLINDNLFGPTDWVRLWFEVLPDNELHIALAIDTTTDKNDQQNVSPVFNSNPNENKYDLCTNEDSIISFMSNYTGCGWVCNWLNSLFTINPEESQTIALATYVHLIRILNSGTYMPKIQLLSDQSEIIDLDLAIDVGNSHTCAILFETPNEGVVNFNKVKKLQLRDHSNPTKIYSDAFSTRVVFRDENFGMKDDFFAQNEKFKWPSPVRIGTEAENLINSFQVKRNVQQENKSFYSSPKRYLWDDKLAKQPWNFHDNFSDIPRKVYKKGVSEQLKSDGSICQDGAWGATPLYSRKTLMTFLFLEIFSQAIAQINSFEFRSTHGKPNARRRLRHVVITCPTGMIKSEQFALRKAAQDAADIMKNFEHNMNSENAMVSPVISEAFDIIPRIADIKLNLDELDRKVDWMYDEATCSQLVFLYGLIQHKFDGNPTDLFKLFGHKKPDGKNALTVGSLDIGGGTSDLLICEYNVNYNNSVELIPKPLYFESFHLAGDNLMKNIIQSIIIEGKVYQEDDVNCSGVIENKGFSLYGNDIYDKLNGFFGKDAATVSYLTKLMRINFVNQIGIPLAHAFLNCANKEEAVTLNFDDVFKDKKPGNDLLNFFAEHFGFRFEDLVWNFNPKKVNAVIRITFSKLIKQVAKLMHKFHCDYIIISGRPCSFKEIERIFLEIHPVQSNRFINLNNYWIGKWYPFSDNNGYVQDPKTIVATGALIGFMGTKFFKLNKFKINPQYLKTDLTSTANYIGSIKENVIKEVIFTPEQNTVKMKVFGIPHHLGIKNINSTNYPARDIIQIQYNEKFINSIAMNQQSNQANSYQNMINRLNTKLPYELTLTREFDIDKEKIIIEDVVNAEGESQSTSLFILKTITLPDENGYWFDTAEFTLSINSRS
jgi:hypothetical protein